MNKSPLTTVLLTILTASALASVVLCWLYISNARELHALETQRIAVGNNLTWVNMLASDTLAYSKENPAIDAILEAADLKPPKSAATTPPRPLGK